MTATPTPDDGALAACPLCRGVKVEIYLPQQGETVFCAECGCEGPLALWNTRSPAPVSGEAGETKALEAVAAVVLNAARDPATWTARIPSESIEDWVRRAIAIAIALQRPKVRQAFTQHCAGAGREGS